MKILLDGQAGVPGGEKGALAGAALRAHDARAGDANAPHLSGCDAALRKHAPAFLRGRLHHRLAVQIVDVLQIPGFDDLAPEVHQRDGHHVGHRHQAEQVLIPGQLEKLRPLAAHAAGVGLAVGNDDALLQKELDALHDGLPADADLRRQTRHGSHCPEFEKLQDLSSIVELQIGWPRGGHGLVVMKHVFSLQASIHPCCHCNSLSITRPKRKCQGILRLFINAFNKYSFHWYHTNCWSVAIGSEMCYIYDRK